MKASGRKRVGQPISVALTPELKLWIDSKKEHGGTRSEVIRRILTNAMRKEGGFKTVRVAIVDQDE